MSSYMQSEEELAEFQKLSNEYEAEATGPLVGVRQPSSAIIDQYLAADHVYRTKTLALPQKYSWYRTCRGDGRCGWRAIAFGYFESLLRIGDRAKFLQEETRLKSLRNTCVVSGVDADIIKEFDDLTCELLRKTSAALQGPGRYDAQKVEADLVEAFNDEGTQNYIITHLRMLATAQMKTNPANYADFILPHTIDEYTSQYVMAHNSEINDISINALTEAFLRPAGITLEIVYLDRSEGTEANVHHYGPMTLPPSTVRLLYRPGHYDLIYKPEDIVTPSNPQTFLQHHGHVPHFSEQASTTDSELLLSIPMGSLAQGGQFGWFNNSLAVAGSPETHETSPSSPVPSAYPPATVQTSLPQQYAQAPSEIDFAMSDPSSASSPSVYNPVSPSNPFRPSQWNVFHPAPAIPRMPNDAEFRTSQFKNSHFNQCHFLNPDFIPEQWNPGQENASGRGRQTGRNRHGTK